MDWSSWGVSLSSCRSSVFNETRLMWRSSLRLWPLTYLATFRAAVAWEIPSSLGDRHGGAAAAVGIPDDLAFIGVHPLCQGPLLGQQFRWGDRIAGVFHRQGPWCR